LRRKEKKEEEAASRVLKGGEKLTRGKIIRDRGEGREGGRERTVTLVSTSCERSEGGPFSPSLTQKLAWATG
jgi:hypothetical protein